MTAQEEMKILLKASSLLLFGLFPIVCSGRQWGPYPCGSGTFSRHGELSQLTVVGAALSLDVTRPDGTRESGRATIPTDQYGVECSVFITDDGTLVAAVTRLPLKEPESVHVWDVTANKWRSSFDFVPGHGLDGQITFLGFWKGGRDLLVESARQKDVTHSAMALALVDVSGGVVAGPKPVNYSLVDVERGRAWVNPPGSGMGCFYRASAFDFGSSDGAKPASPNVPCTCFGGSTQLVGFPSAEIIVGAEDYNSGRGTSISSCDIPSGGRKHLVIPLPRKQLLDAYVEASPVRLDVSPRGKFFAVDVVITRWSHFDTQRAEWDELYVFQTSPFREIGRIGPKKRCDSLLGFAADDSNEKVQVAANWCGQWSVGTLNSSISGSR